MEVYESITKLEDHLGALASKDEQVKEAIERADELTARLESRSATSMTSRTKSSS